jgi:antitoxin component of RelBE/YafQ-DinJ toxin-antitoxin module
MAATEIVQATVSTVLRQQATAILAEKGLTLEDAVRLLVEQVVEQHELPFVTYRPGPGAPGAPPFQEIGDGRRFPTYDDWFRSEVANAIQETEAPDAQWISHEDVLRQTTQRRNELLTRIAQKSQPA